MKISDLTIGDMVTIPLVVKSATAREAKTKKPYLAMELYDGSDIIHGNYWDWSTGKIPEVNTILDVTAQVNEWSGAKQLNIKAMSKNKTMHLAEFAPNSGSDVAAAYNEALALMGQVNDDMLRNLALGCLEALHDKWLEVPGAVGVHHAYIGGTLLHSLSVAKIAESIAAAIPEANADLCIVGGMLHDIGKLFTYRINGIVIEMTDSGRLYDHTFIGAELVGNFAENVCDVNDDKNCRKLDVLRHIILSHHGKLEYGAPVPPMCIEAFIVSHADGIDAEVEQVRSASKKVPSNLKWTERIYTLGNKSQLTTAYMDYVMDHEESNECE